MVHTKGRWARHQFLLTDWQRDDIIRPLFGEVVWDAEQEVYRRRFRLAWIEVARKNGKSELLAGIALYLLCADDEEAAEIYGAALDRDQARKVFDVAKRMVELSPILSKQMDVIDSRRRIVHPATASVYEVVAADAAGNLGHNASGVVFDEVLTQREGDLWNALRQSSGTRLQPLMVAATTAGNNPASFAQAEHDECLRVAADPARAPHRFVYIRSIDAEDDPLDESVWHKANPALGDFKMLSAMREEAAEAHNDPAKLNAFLQFHCNRWVQQVTRWMPLHLWDACGTSTLSGLEAKCENRPAFGGLDLAATTDLASLCWLFSNGDDPVDVVWRFWTTEDQLPTLDKYTGGKASVWVRQGLLTACPGDWIDLDMVFRQIDADLARWPAVEIGYDKWGANAIVQRLLEGGANCVEVRQGFGLSSALKEIMRLIKAEKVNHAGNPIARWNIDSAEVKTNDQEYIKLVKPDRNANSARVDGVAAMAMALDRMMRHEQAATVWAMVD